LIHRKARRVRKEEAARGGEKRWGRGNAGERGGAAYVHVINFYKPHTINFSGASRKPEQPQKREKDSRGKWFIIL